MMHKGVPPSSPRPAPGQPCLLAPYGGGRVLKLDRFAFPGKAGAAEGNAKRSNAGSGPVDGEVWVLSCSFAEISANCRSRLPLISTCAVARLEIKPRALCAQEILA